MHARREANLGPRRIAPPPSFPPRAEPPMTPLVHAVPLSGRLEAATLARVTNSCAKTDHREEPTNSPSVVLTSRLPCSSSRPGGGANDSVCLGDRQRSRGGTIEIAHLRADIITIPFSFEGDCPEEACVSSQTWQETAGLMVRPCFTTGAIPGSGGEAQGRQDPVIEHHQHVTLEEVLHGCTKKMKISQKVMGPDGRTPKREEKVLTIIVKTGCKAGTKITFQREGDQLRATIPANIVFIIRDKPHPQFKREGTDIRYTARVTLKHAL
ncbi:hypothetical protein HPB51_005811 [Rhipicephalus microplus]|uniref:Chaperone DnaJ C-terminal domain-containing protein n=1 Tax=Rhipicephalus microplus TaxID=6941 RepID=A0A9J6D9B8_RHIMP|nr:hypothetical protein HPB51_005811 [Rhipicephalus microplus]